MSLVTAGCG